MPAFAKHALRVLQALVLPLLVLVVTQAAIRSVARYCGEDPGKNRTYVHWDAYRYIDIARRGYVEVESDPLASNTGWFPGYALMTRSLSRTTGMGVARSGRAVSAAALLGLLAVLGGALLPLTKWPHRLLILLAAGFFPGWMYFHAVFPQSLLVFFTLAAVALAARGRWLLAGLSGALAAFTYPTGVVVIVPLTVQALGSGQGLRQRLVALLQAPGVAGVGLVAVAALQWVQVGIWDAYARAKGHTGAGLHNPFTVLVDYLRPLFSLERTPEALIAADTLATTLLLLGAAAVWWIYRDRMQAVDTALLLYALVLWVFVSAAGPHMSLYRQAAPMVGLLVVLARLPPAAMAGVLAVLVPLGLAMATLFFRDILI